MPRPAATLAELRSLVAAWTPDSPRAPAGVVPTGIGILDTVLGGGLPAGQLSEGVIASGGQLLLASLLESTRHARQRLALVDAMDAFAPEAFPADSLRHLVWARCNRPEDAFPVADVLARDGNYAALVIDLREVPAAVLNRLPRSTWHRLHRVGERQGAALLVLSEHELVPAVRLRFRLTAPFSLAELQKTHPEQQQHLQVESLRGSALTERIA